MEKDKAPIVEEPVHGSFELIKRPALKLDVERYQKMLDSTDLNEEEKQDFLETVWSIVIGFVDLGFEIHPLQQVNSDGCGQELDLSSFLASDVVSLKKTIAQNQFTKAADPILELKAERKET